MNISPWVGDCDPEAEWVMCPALGMPILAILFIFFLNQAD
ncbi:hypothetical protein NT01EI_2387 [Edwardsiella ictaluri 93-146]|uniref:Uncharacterized protein n=1 Tax=Edwardsiella ictaluri (strain 93-146) TaxID=634503 RepID=C5BA77_EDWI9|nr:hypothetical protein NT01EI_2387 [Edwardsiella ictaluri 93-146]